MMTCRDFLVDRWKFYLFAITVKCRQTVSPWNLQPQTGAQGAQAVHRVHNLVLDRILRDLTGGDLEILLVVIRLGVTVLKKTGFMCFQNIANTVFWKAEMQNILSFNVHKASVLQNSSTVSIDDLTYFLINSWSTDIRNLFHKFEIGEFPIRSGLFTPSLRKTTYDITSIITITITKCILFSWFTYWHILHI